MSEPGGHEGNLAEKFLSAQLALREIREKIFSSNVSEPDQATQLAFEYLTRNFQARFHADPFLENVQSTAQATTNPSESRIDAIVKELTSNIDVVQANKEAKKEMLDVLFRARQGDYQGMKEMITREGESMLKHSGPPPHKIITSHGAFPVISLLDQRVRASKLKTLARSIPDHGIPLTPLPPPTKPPVR